jgi:hypothetical protein
MDECPTTPQRLMTEPQIESPAGPYDFSPSVKISNVFNNKKTNNKYSEVEDPEEEDPEEEDPADEVDDPESVAIAAEIEKGLEAYADKVMAEFDKKQVKMRDVKKPAPKRKPVEQPEGIVKERQNAAKCARQREARYLLKGKVVEKPRDDFLKTGNMDGRPRLLNNCLNFWCDPRGCACGASAKW